MKLRITYRELSIFAGIVVALAVILILWVSQMESNGTFFLSMTPELSWDSVNLLIDKTLIFISKATFPN